jgi:hypothetical protein
MTNSEFTVTAITRDGADWVIDLATTVSGVRIKSRFEVETCVYRDEVFVDRTFTTYFESEGSSVVTETDDDIYWLISDGDNEATVTDSEYLECQKRAEKFAENVAYNLAVDLQKAQTEIITARLAA